MLVLCGHCRVVALINFGSLAFASTFAWLNLQDIFPLFPLFLQQGFPCEKTKLKLIAKMIKNINLFIRFSLPELLRVYKLHILLLLMIELFVPIVESIGLKAKPNTIRNFKITITIRIYDVANIITVMTVYIERQPISSFKT